MSRSRPPKCPTGKGCRCCHGKPQPPARDQRKTQVGRIDTTIEQQADQAWMDSFELRDDFNHCDCADCRIERARAEMPVGPPRF